MGSEKYPIVVTTPEELACIVATAVRSALNDAERLAPKRKKRLSPKDIQEEFGIHRRVLESWRVQGIGPAFTNIGRRVFYDRAVFERFLDSGNVRTTGWVDR